MNYNQFEHLVLEEFLEDMINPWASDINSGRIVTADTEEAKSLVMRTILHESGGLKYIRQVNAQGDYGPGFGLISMQRNRWFCTWSAIDSRKNASPEWKKLYHWIRTEVMKGQFDDIEELHWNLGLNVVMCRLAYLLVPSTLPPVDLDSQAQYWFDHYNQSPEELREEREGAFKRTVNNFGIK